MQGNIDASQAVSGGRFLGFFTVLLILTLNADNGKDLLDVLVPHIAAQTEALNDSE
jgi:hypothetical protein